MYIFSSCAQYTNPTSHWHCHTLCDICYVTFSMLFYSRTASATILRLPSISNLRGAADSILYTQKAYLFCAAHCWCGLFIRKPVIYIFFIQYNLASTRVRKRCGEVSDCDSKQMQFSSTLSIVGNKCVARARVFCVLVFVCFFSARNNPTATTHLQRRFFRVCVCVLNCWIII